MAKLTKDQQKQFDDLKTALAMALSWRRTEEVLPDLCPPAGQSLTQGWMVSVYGGTCRVQQACSSSFSHGSGWNLPHVSNGAVSLYSTRERALRAARYMLEQDFLQTLVGIDMEISQEAK